MTDYFTERRSLTHAEMAADIARHLQVRQLLGKAVIITERSTVLLSAVRRQWMKIIQALQRECSRTLDATLRAELQSQIQAMQELQFTSKTPEKTPRADIFFVEIDDIQALPDDYHTIYLCIQTQQARQLVAQVNPGCVVVEYL